MAPFLIPVLNANLKVLGYLLCAYRVVFYTIPKHHSKDTVCKFHFSKVSGVTYRTSKSSIW